MAEASPSERRYIVDTNILAYYALGTAPFCEEVSALFSMPYQLIAPDSWRAEFLNVIWQAIRYQEFDLRDGLELLEGMESLVNWSVSVRSLWWEALVFAHEHNCSTYDTLLVVLAQRERSILLTYDQRLLKVFPNTAKKPIEVLTD